jgi:hypothetical protein
MTETMTGGCACGRIRYTAQIASDEAYLCHCRMCQRATGGVSIAFVNLPKASVTWATEPDWYASSPIAQRPFCSKCGTPLGFSYPDGPNIDLTVGSFDDPSRRAFTRLGSTRMTCRATDATPTRSWSSAGRKLV